MAQYFVIHPDTPQRRRLQQAAEIVRAFGLRGETVAETASRLQMTEGAVRVALHRALKSIARLRERMIE